MGRFEGWTEANIDTLFKRLASIECSLNEHIALELKRQRRVEDRLDRLDNWRAYVLGIAAGAAALASVLGGVVGVAVARGLL